MDWNKITVGTKLFHNKTYEKVTVTRIIPTTDGLPILVTDKEIVFEDCCLWISDKNRNEFYTKEDLIALRRQELEDWEKEFASK